MPNTPPVPAPSVAGAPELSIEIPEDVRAEIAAELLPTTAPPSRQTNLEIPADVLAERDAEERARIDVPGIDDNMIAEDAADDAE